MKLWAKVALLSLGGFGVGFGTISAFFGNENASADSSSKDSGKTTDVDWSRLRELNLASGLPSDFLKSVHSRTAPFAGFLVSQSGVQPT